MRTKGLPKSGNVVVVGDPSRKKLGNEDVGQDTGKLETWLDKMQPTPSTPRKKPAPKKNISKGGRSKKTA